MFVCLFRSSTVLYQHEQHSFVTTVAFPPSATETPQQQLWSEHEWAMAMTIATYWATYNCDDPSNQQHSQMNIGTSCQTPVIIIDIGIFSINNSTDAEGNSTTMAMAITKYKPTESCSLISQPPWLPTMMIGDQQATQHVGFPRQYNK